MNFSTKIELDFFTELLENNKFPSIYDSLNYFGKEKCNDLVPNTRGNSKFYSLRLVPEYINPSISSNSDYVTEVVKQYNWGYSIHLDGMESIDDYLSKQFKSKYRSIIRRYVNRLEHCFPIKYRLFHGEMDLDTYRYLMSSLQEMIRARFGQRKETHKDAHRWGRLVNDTYDKIVAGKASLFVIYDGEHPIQISLNYHFDQILFSAISSYDIDYAKFGLGHIEIYMQLIWCIENGFTIYEMGVGGMDYKRRWSNNIYRYEHHIVYPKSNLTVVPFALLETTKIKTKEYLKSKKINELVARLKNGILRNRSMPVESPKVEITDISSTDIDSNKYQIVEHSEIDSKKPFLKKYLFDFLYSKVDSIDKVKVLCSRDDIGNYIFKGTSTSQHLMIEPKKGEL